MPALSLVGDVIERQTFLNGTVAFQLEGETQLGDESFAWSLVVTLPKAEGDEIGEGDFALTGESDWLAGVAAGSHSTVLDDDTDARVHSLRLELLALSEDGTDQRWQTGELSLRIAGTDAQGDLCLREYELL